MSQNLIIDNCAGGGQLFLHNFSRAFLSVVLLLIVTCRILIMKIFTQSYPRRWASPRPRDDVSIRTSVAVRLQLWRERRPRCDAIHDDGAVAVVASARGRVRLC